MDDDEDFFPMTVSDDDEHGRSKYWAMNMSENLKAWNYTAKFTGEMLPFLVNVCCICVGP